VQGDDAGDVCVVDRAGKVTRLANDWITAYGLAWHPSGKDVLFTATRVGVARAIWSVPAGGGAERLLVRTTAELTIQDVSHDGRILMTSDAGKVGIVGLAPGQGKERDLSLLDWSLVRGISRDGKLIAFDESGEGAAGHQGVYVRKTDGSPAVRLGDGMAGGFAPDERWFVSMSMRIPKEVVLLPVKAGEPRTLPRHDLAVHRPTWAPDGKNIVIAASTRDEGVRLYVVDAEGAEPPRAITPEGIVLGSFPISPDGKFVVAQSSDQTFYKYSLDSGEAEAVPSLMPEDRPVRFGFDARYLYGLRRGEVPAQIFRLDLATGQKESIHELIPPDPAGIVEVVSVVLTADAASYAYSYHRILSDLFLVEGVR
jgi:Tol biopolymer transport system component